LNGADVIDGGGGSDAVVDSMNISNGNGDSTVVGVDADAIIIGGSAVVMIIGGCGGAGGPTDCGIVAGALMRRTGSASFSSTEIGS